MSVSTIALRRHRALAEPSRARILAEITDHGPVDAAGLAKRVSLHVNTVRAHLAALEEAGLVASERGAVAGRGRPRLVYRSTDVEETEARRYRLLAEILTALVARSGAAGTPELEEIGEAWGHHLVESPPPFAALDPDEAVERLLTLLEGSGFEPALVAGPDGDEIHMRPCPFLELARRHPTVVCPIHLGLVRGALSELRTDVTVERLEPFRTPALCVAHLGRRSDPSRAGAASAT